MAETISGRGRLGRGDEVLCRVTYQLQRPEGEEERFTLTDGVIEIEESTESDVVFDLEPGEELTLHLAEPLRDGRETLTVVIEPYGGHRPDERYQVRIKEEA
ncbi:MAG: hypothetical protein ACOC9Z_07995 [Chloroflexota bacterium]